MAGLFPESLTPARSYFPGMGQAVADRTINRKIQKPYTADAVVTFKIPRDDSSPLDSQVKAYAKSQGYGSPTTTSTRATVRPSPAGSSRPTPSRPRSGPTSPTGSRWATPRSIRACARPHGSVDALFDGTTNKVFTTSSRPCTTTCVRPRSDVGPAPPARRRHAARPETWRCSRTARPARPHSCCSYLLLNGSGVGRDYSDAMIQADLTRCHRGAGDRLGPCGRASGKIQGFLTERDARHLYAGRTITTFTVPDSREGWAKSVEIIERSRSRAVARRS